MKELDTDILISLVDEFLEPFGLDSDFDSDFFYDSEDETVFFSVIVSERADRLFKEYVHKTFSFDIPNIFMLNLLHEIGHAETLSQFSKQRLKTVHKQKEAISERLDQTNSDACYIEYFDLSIEKVATAWAVEYYKANTKRCEDFYSRFLKELHRQYAEIGLTE